MPARTDERCDRAGSDRRHLWIVSDAANDLGMEPIPEVGGDQRRLARRDHRQVAGAVRVKKNGAKACRVERDPASDDLRQAGSMLDHRRIAAPVPWSGESPI